ncbi:MAG: response regulator [Ferruginibacter sp.]
MKKVLIIDDDPRNIFALNATLVAKGFNCISALSALQGIAFIRQTPPDIVLIDMMMPEMDGYQAMSHIKEIDPGLPVIAVTAQAMLGDRDKCLSSGADDYISKPIDVDKLMSIIKKHEK